MEIFSKLGINLKLLIAQIINFIILLYVLKRFAYAPIVKILNDRTKKIEEGLKNAEEARKKVLAMAQKEEEVLAKARADAREILKKAEEAAKKSREEIMIESKTQAEKMIADAKANIELEKEKTLREIKREIADLIVVATEKVIEEKLDHAKNKELIKKIIE